MDSILKGKQLDEFLMECRLNFRFFCEEVLSETLGEKLMIKSFHIEWFNMFLNNKRSCVIAGRGTGKTTVLGVAMPLWISLFNKHKDFLIVSNAMHQSVMIIDKIRMFIEENELLRTLRPSNPELSWTKTDLNTSTLCTIKAKPFGHNIKGGHYDYVLCDEGSLYEDHDVYFRSIVPTVNARNGNIMVIGTPMTLIDLLAKLEENSEYVVNKYPVEKEGRFLWKEKYNTELLERLKNEMGDDSFTREYLCEIRETEESPIRFRDLLHACDTELSFEKKTSPMDSYFVGADFALSSKGDWSVFIVVKARKDGKIQLVDIRRVRGVPFRTQLEMLKAIYAKFIPVKMYLDKSTFGELFVEELMKENLPIIGFSFTQENRQAVFNTTIRRIQEGNLVIPYANDVKGQIDNLMKELTSFVVDKTRSGYATYISRGKYDDTAIAFMLAIQAATTVKPFVSYIRSGDRKDTERKKETIIERTAKRFTIKTRY